MATWARCTKCRDEIVSISRHHFKTCQCGWIFVDGGDDYFRCGAGDFADVEIKDEKTGNWIPMLEYVKQE